MSGISAKKRSTRVLTSGSVSSDSSHKVKKPPGGAKLSSSDMALKGSGSGQVVRQFNNMDTDGEASEGEKVSDSKMNTPQAKHFNNSAIVGSLLGSINFNMEEEEEVSLPLHKFFSLDKVLIDPKIIKTQVEVANQWFWGATTLSKFEGIIRSTFTFEASMEKTVLLAKKNDITVNSNLKKQEIRSDRAVMIKKIPMDTPKDMIITAVSEFGEIKSIKIQLISMWQKAVVEFAEPEQAEQLASKWFFLIGKDSVHVAKVMGDHETWAFRDQFRALLFTLPVGTTAHDFGTLLEGTGEKTCVINHSLKTGNRTHCAVVCFESNEAMESAFCMEPIFGSMKLLWARLDLVRCEWCEKFGYSALECDAEVASASQSPNLVPLTPPSSVIPSVNTPHPSISDSLIVDDSDLGSNMVLDVPLIQSISLSSSNDNSQLGLSSSKVLTSKIGILELKLVALNASIGSILAKLEQMCAGSGPQEDIIHWHKEINNMISIITETKLKDRIRPWIMNKFVGVRVFTSGLNSGHMGSGITIIMNNFLAQHVCKVSDIPGRFLSIKLLFKNKLSVLVLGLYAGSSLAVNDVNSLVARAVNESSFIILGGDFNEDGSHKSVSFRKCFDLGLVNSLNGSLFGKEATWANSYGVAKIIDYVFVLSSLVNTILDHDVSGVEEYFDTDHKAVSVSVGLGGLLDVQLNTLRKQIKFKEDTSANAAMFHDKFYAAKMSLDLNTMWGHLHQVFKDFDSVYNKVLSRFHKLELLVSKIVKASYLVSHEEFVSLLDTWKGIDSANASVVDSLFLSGSHFDTIHSALAKIRKSYHSFKLSESNCAKESQIKLVIDKRMKSFELNKSHIMVLDYLVVGDELVLDPAPVKSKVDEIMEGWTRKRKVVLDVNDDYVFNEAFSGVMSLIDFDELFGVVSNLPDGKAAGLSGISNKLWKHCNISVFNMLLREAWVSIIPKPYEWESVLTNTHSIALIEMACKILSKILSDKIFSACSTHNVLRDDNFLVLKDMTTQFPIFAVGSVDIRKAYDSVGWEHLEKCLVRIKMCNRFIRFFGSIHKDCTNRVMTDFGLTDGYRIHDGLDQGKESMCEYRLISHFVSKSGHVESQAGLSSCFAAGAFIDNTIWVGSSQNTTQHILDVASEFFRINNISINNNKTVAIPINCRVGNSALFISGSPISYLGIFLSTEGLSRPNLVKVHSDICFFTNLVLKKAISDKQFLYLVSVVFQPIISYRTQFSFDAMIRKGLKLKSGLPLNFSSNSIHHSSFYGLKSFLQIQSENKIASLINFANSGRIVLCWRPIHLLSSPVRICVSASNNFLWDVHVNCFGLSAVFLAGKNFSPACIPVLANMGLLDILGFSGFVSICDHLSRVNARVLSVYTNRSLRNLGTVGCKAGAVAFFKNIGMGLGVGVSGLMSSTMAELQAIALALECVPVFSNVYLFLDSQSALDAYKSELVKSHSGVLGNKHIDVIASTDSVFDWFLPFCLDEHFLMADGNIVSGNSRHFVHDTFHAMCCACWEVGSGSKFLPDNLQADVDWSHSSLVWHPNLHMTTSFTSRISANAHSYFMKALHHRLPVAVQKRLYNRLYPSVLCLYCGDVEVSDHVFSCKVNDSAWHRLLDSHMDTWKTLSGSSVSSLCLL
ncbi:hypothetical protein G9A89_009792 [Geosiphon pyriformis]|nr:hypothetical protein G9A89_009792 [Geosiphon pyriformis]